MELSNRANAYAFSGIREVFEEAAKYQNIINFGIGEPGFRTEQRVIDAVADALNSGMTKYVSNAGWEPLREAIAAKYTAQLGRPVPVSQVHVFHGASQALLMAFLCCLDPGEEILVPGPYYPGYYGMAQLAEVRIKEVPVYEKDRFHIKAENLQQAVSAKTKALLINNPSNPLGSVTPAEDLAEIAKFAVEHDLWVISDEPYEALLYDGRIHSSIAAFPGMEERTVICNSVSKTYAMTGFRVGYAVAPAAMCLQMTKIQSSTTSSISGSMQAAALAALTGPQDYAAEMLAGYDRARKLMVEGLNRIRGISCLMPEGAFYAFPNISGTGMSSRELAFRILRETQVVTVPGSAFGRFGEGYLRCSFAACEADIREGLARIERLLGSK